MKIKALYVLDEVTRPFDGDNARVLGSDGHVARALGVAKKSMDLTIEDRGKRLISRKPDYSKSPENVSKLYPQDNDSRDSLGELLRIGFNQQGCILAEPADKVIEVIAAYFDWCFERKYPVNKMGLITWLGVTKTTFNRHIQLDDEISNILQKSLDFIDQMRIGLTDEGKINPVWNMYVMANHHEYTRSDSKAPINIQINNGGYDREELDSIINDFIDVEEY